MCNQADMSELLLTAIALLLCLLLVWLRVQSTARTVQFRAFRGAVQAPGGIGPLDFDPLSGRPVARVHRFSLRGAGFDLGHLASHDVGLGIEAGHTVTVIFAERERVLPQPALLFNHDTTRWRARPAAWLALRGDAASHYLPVLVFFAALCLVWLGAAAAHAAADPVFAAVIDPAVMALAGLALALGSFALLAAVALRSLDQELERRAVVALRAALFALPMKTGRAAPCSTWPRRAPAVRRRRRN
jgi:hypothetical protein